MLRVIKRKKEKKEAKKLSRSVAAVPQGTDLEITYTAPVFKTFGKIAP
jgi:hypothetical protein